MVIIAAMEPANDRPEDPAEAEDGFLGLAAAMEPANDRPEDGSRDSSRLTCVNRSLCERSAVLPQKSRRSGLVKKRKRPLTCVRALPGVWLTTSALANLERLRRLQRVRR